MENIKTNLFVKEDVKNDNKPFWLLCDGVWNELKYAIINCNTFKEEIDYNKHTKIFEIINNQLPEYFYDYHSYNHYLDKYMKFELDPETYIKPIILDEYSLEKLHNSKNGRVSDVEWFLNELNRFFTDCVITMEDGERLLIDNMKGIEELVIQELGRKHVKIYYPLSDVKKWISIEEFASYKFLEKL